MLKIDLAQVPEVRGIYGASKVLPARMRYLAPDAAASLQGLDLVYSDMYRNAAGSLQAVKDGRGAQPPGYSGHNYGLSVDLAVDETLKLRGWSYAELLDVMAAAGWHCYCRDAQRGKEDWHFNHLGPSPERILSKLDTKRRGTWATAAELAIQERYGSGFSMSAEDRQTTLHALNLYTGDVDGKWGPKSQAAREAFERTWDLDGSDGRFERTLAFIAATLEEEGLTS